MEYGKSLDKPESRMVTVHHNYGQPVRFHAKKERMSKKERLRQKRDRKEGFEK
ncbi:hypothetical protein LQZ19_08525 [Treponema primitia]|uniref:hypothetical protein n=1 Tax=Treponema primitia TaxID=88058 RepID=UPI003980A06C